MWFSDVVKSRLRSAGLDAVGVCESFFFFACNFTSGNDAILMGIWVNSLVGGLSAYGINSWDCVWSGSFIFYDSYS